MDDANVFVSDQLDFVFCQMNGMCHDRLVTETEKSKGESFFAYRN